jgi:L-ascorbate metabolism protein UlaG (beta-lactamase superfamily)
MRLAPILALLAAPALAQDRIPSHCIALSQGPETMMHASFRAPVAEDTVRITYVDHAMFLIQTPTLSAMTDYTGFVGNVEFTPDVVTMNNAHGTHWTAFPDPAIPHVLQGWATDGSAADHYLDLGEMLVRNIPTDIRNGMGVRDDGNSIFVFEAAGLCIGHLGHLHHEPTPEQYAMLGRVDVVMAPVDGGLTLDLPTMIRVLERLRARVVIPMHWFGTSNLETFLAGMEQAFAIERTYGQDLTLTLANLPDRPTVMVLTPALLSD